MATLLSYGEQPSPISICDPSADLEQDVGAFLAAPEEVRSAAGKCSYAAYLAECSAGAPPASCSPSALCSAAVVCSGGAGDGPQPMANAPKNTTSKASETYFFIQFTFLAGVSSNSIQQRPIISLPHNKRTILPGAKKRGLIGSLIRSREVAILIIYSVNPSCPLRQTCSLHRFYWLRLALRTFSSRFRNASTLSGCLAARFLASPRSSARW